MGLIVWRSLALGGNLSPQQNVLFPFRLDHGDSSLRQRLGLPACNTACRRGDSVGQPFPFPVVQYVLYEQCYNGNTVF